MNLPSEVTQRMICAGFPREEGKDSCAVSEDHQLCLLTLGAEPEGLRRGEGSNLTRSSFLADSLLQKAVGDLH